VCQSAGLKCCIGIAGWNFAGEAFSSLLFIAFLFRMTTDFHALTEIFLPSYTDHRNPRLDRPDPVHEIVLSDEEIAGMFPS
jgi:hypothetical protein